MREEPAQDRVVGWHPDPDTGRDRYWDGHGWVDMPVPSGAGWRYRLRSMRRVVAAVACVLAVVGIIGIAWTATRGIERPAGVASVSQSVANQEKARRDAERKAEENRIAAEREHRASAVDQLEESVATMARDHIAQGIYDGTVVSVACAPVGGGTTDDLSIPSTVLDCFVVTGDDGAQQQYHATIDWAAGNYTYGYGAP